MQRFVNTAVVNYVIALYIPMLCDCVDNGRCLHLLVIRLRLAYDK